MLDNIRKFLTILDNIITILRILLQLRKERAEIATRTILNNIRQHFTILYNNAQHWIGKKKHPRSFLRPNFKASGLVSSHLEKIYWSFMQ